MSISPALWLSDYAGVYRTNDRVVRVRGEDARTWLNGQITNDVRELSGDQARYALALTLKGRVLSDLWALEDAPGMALVLPAAGSEAALAQFEQHIIMEDVELLPEPQVVVLTVQGPRASEVVAVLPGALRCYACARVGGSGFDCWVPSADAESAFAGLAARASELGGGAFDDASWAAAHVQFGVPRVGVDFGPDTYPQEAGLTRRALSFDKGCYLGQEVAYMLEKRGQPAQRLVLLESASAVECGASVNDAENKPLGEVTSSASVPVDAASVRAGASPAPDTRWLALAYVKRASAEPERAVWVAGSPARILRVIGA